MKLSVGLWGSCVFANMGSTVCSIYSGTRAVSIRRESSWEMRMSGVSVKLSSMVGEWLFGQGV